MAQDVRNIDNSALVLVCVMKEARDLEIARALGWYRIPLRSSPKVVAVDYLAFYQTAGFGEDQRWRVNYAARVLGHELQTRWELFRDEPEHPHAHEEYFKIQLGPLMPLPQPIAAGKWKRLTFLYTTGRRLLTAKKLQDLAVKDEERTLLWKGLRERASQDTVYHGELLDEAEFFLDAKMTLAVFGLTADLKGGNDEPVV